MKHLYRLLLTILAFVWADVAWAQDNTNDSFKDGFDSFEQGVYWFNDTQYFASKMYFERAIRCFDEHLKEHPQDTLTITILGYSYHNLYFVYRERNQTKEAVECLEKALLYLPEDEIAGRFKMHYYYGQYLLLGDSLSGVEPNYCRAFREYDEAIKYDFDFKEDTARLPLFKDALYEHAYLLFYSYLQSFPDTISVYGNRRNLPEWGTCMGDRQLDRCMDDLNRIIHLEQADSLKTKVDTLALVLLGECYYYREEFDRVTDCYEKSGITPEQLVFMDDIIPIDAFRNSYILQGTNKGEQYEGLLKATAEYWYKHYRLLYDDRACYKDEEMRKTGYKLNWAQIVMGYYIVWGEYEKALDFWYKIKNNFSFDGLLNCYQGLCYEVLGDSLAAEKSGFAADLNPKNRLAHYGLLLSNLNNGTLSANRPSGDTLNAIDTSYYLLGGLSSFYSKDYEAAVEHFSELCVLDSTNTVNYLMLAMCNQFLAENENDSEQKNRFIVNANKYFCKVIDMEESICKFENAPYAYIYLGKPNKAIEVMEQILQTDLVNPEDSLTCFGAHYQAAEVYAKVGKLRKAKMHLKQAFVYCHTPMILSCAENAPLLENIHEYVEDLVEQYRMQQDIAESPIHRTLFVCNIPYKKRGLSNTRTIDTCYINGILVEGMIFDPGADYVKLTTTEARRIGLTINDTIGWTPLVSAFGTIESKPLVSLDSFQIGNIVLENVQAVIDDSPNAQLLIGCTVWNNLTVEMPANKMIIRLTYIKESIEIPEEQEQHR